MPSDNYPPGVTGNEWQITGECPECGHDDCGENGEPCIADSAAMHEAALEAEAAGLDEIAAEAEARRQAQPDPSQLILEYVEAKRERLMAIATGTKPSSREGEALRALMDFADGRKI